MKDSRYRNKHSYHNEKTAAKPATSKSATKKKNKSRCKKKKSSTNTSNLVAFTSTPGVPVNHPCYNCPLAKIYGDKIFCFTPRCMRKVFENCGKSRSQEATV